MKYVCSARLAVVRTVSQLSCDVTWEDPLDLSSTRDGPRAGSILSIGIWAGSTHFRGGRFDFQSESNRPTIICRHLGCMVTLSVVLTSQHLSCGLAISGREVARSCSSMCHASFFLGWSRVLLHPWQIP